MEEMIRNLLDFTRGRLGGGIPVTRDEMDLEALLRQSIDELAAVHDGCSIKLASRGPVGGTWDRARLGQVMSNLIGNACQHGAAGEPIDVSLTVDGDTAVVAIANKGTMIEPQQLDTIFEPFRRLEQSDRARSSSIGLGLYIVKAIVTAHQGTIAVQSSPQATTFTVRLPRNPPDSPRSART